MEIEKNVPLPMARGKHGQIRIVADKMNVGDSVVVQNASQAQALVQRLRRQSGGDPAATTRKLDDDTYRVWRTK
tara:strand:+ start:261 stop:482 length:222 start_codon:yes stop_codon:yes gene_type:complete